MTKEIHAATLTASQANTVWPVLMCDLDFSSGHVLAHTDVGTLTWNGDNYIGVGDFGGVSFQTESLDLQANGCTLTLTGIDPDYISIALGEHYQGRIGILCLALLNQSHAIVGDPMVIFKGRIDTQNITMGAETAAINVSIESPLADWTRPRVRRYNHEDQKNRYSSDTGLRFVESMVNKEIQLSY